MRWLKHSARRVLLCVGAKVLATKRGQSLMLQMFRQHQSMFMDLFASFTNFRVRFDHVTEWPPTIAGYEDLAFLFNCHSLNAGIALLALDEGAYLYRLIRGLKQVRMAEIGRFKGGGTFLRAAAMDHSSYLESYDSHVWQFDGLRGAELDARLEEVLQRYGLADRVHILKADSTRAVLDGAGYDLVFVDGDHSYAEVKGDFLHWHTAIKPQGHLLFHHSTRAHPFAVDVAAVRQFVREVERDYPRYFVRVKALGSITHFMWTSLPFDTSM